MWENLGTRKSVNALSVAWTYVLELGAHLSHLPILNSLHPDHEIALVPRDFFIRNLHATFHGCCPCMLSVLHSMACPGMWYPWCSGCLEWCHHGGHEANSDGSYELHAGAALLRAYGQQQCCWKRTSRSTRTCWFVELSCACGSMYNNAIKEDVHVGLQAHIHQVPRTTTSRNKEREHGTALEMDFL